MAKSRKVDFVPSTPEKSNVVDSRLFNRLQGELLVQNIDLMASTNNSYSDVFNMIIGELEKHHSENFIEDCDNLRDLLIEYNDDKNNFEKTVELKNAINRLELSDVYKPLTRIIKYRLDIVINSNDSCLKALDQLAGELDKNDDEYAQHISVLNLIKKYIRDPIGATINDNERLALRDLSKTFILDSQYLIGEIDDYIDSTLRTNEEDSSYIMEDIEYSGIEDEQLRDDLIRATNIMNLMPDVADEVDDTAEPVNIELDAGLTDFLARAGILTN